MPPNRNTLFTVVRYVLKLKIGAEEHSANSANLLTTNKDHRYSYRVIAVITTVCEYIEESGEPSFYLS